MHFCFLASNANGYPLHYFASSASVITFANLQAVHGDISKPIFANFLLGHALRPNQKLKFLSNAQGLRSEKSTQEKSEKNLGQDTPMYIQGHFINQGAKIIFANWRSCAKRKNAKIEGSPGSKNIKISKEI